MTFQSAYANGATRLVIDIPCVGVCPGPVTYIRVGSGAVFPLFVAAVDASGNIDANYTGTVSFSSSDPLADLPQPYTFTPTDQGSHIFMNAGTLRTLGAQTLLVSDISGSVSPGAWQVTVDTIASIPAVTSLGKVLFVGILMAAGAWCLYAKY